jgi:hypothetical protein
MRFRQLIVPPTRNTTVRGPSASHAARSVPGPESARLVTSTTRPPRPPLAFVPNPSAPGKAGTAAAMAAAQMNNPVRLKMQGKRVMNKTSDCLWHVSC